MRRYRIAVVPGDGIGREVTPAALEVLEAAGERFGFRLEPTEYEWGCDYFVEHRRMMAADGLERLRDSDAILLGAVGRPDVPDHISLWGLLIPIRRTFRQYVNLRPVKLWPGIESPLRDATPETVDMVIVRENVEGEYSEIGGRMYQDTDDELAIQEAVFTRRGTDRVIAYACELAAPSLRPHLLRHEVERDHPHDAVLGRAVRARDVEPPRAAGGAGADRRARGGRRAAAGAVRRDRRLQPVRRHPVRPRGGGRRLDRHRAVRQPQPRARHPSMFEPVHGSAPDIAGQGVANPVGAIWSAAMMLEHLGETDAAHAVEHAIGAAIEQGPRTPDLGGEGSTAEVTAAVIAAL